MDAQALLLDGGVVTGCINLQTGGQGDGTEWAVGRHGNIVGLGHRGDLLDFGDAAGVRQVGLDDVNQAIGEDAFEVPAREEAFAEGNRDGRRIDDIADGLVVLGEHRLLNEEQTVRLKGPGKDFGHRAMDAPVEVHGEADLGADGFAHGGGALSSHHNFGLGVEVHQLFGGVHFEGGKTLGHGFFGGVGDVGRAIAANP